MEETSRFVTPLMSRAEVLDHLKVDAVKLRRIMVERGLRCHPSTGNSRDHKWKR